MMRRRTFLGVAGTALTTGLAGCSTNYNKKFTMTDIGLVERNNSVAAYIEVQNTSNSAETLNGFLAAYAQDGARVSDWRYVTDDDGIRPNEKRRLYTVFESGDSGWADSNDIGQVVDAFSAKFRLSNAGMDPAKRTYDADNIGEVISLK